MSNLDELLSCVEEVRRAFGSDGDPRALEACDQLQKLFGPAVTEKTRKKAPERKRRGRAPKVPKAPKAQKDENVSPEIKAEESFLSTTISTTSRTRNRKGETPLHASCTKPKFDKIRELLEGGADPNTKDHAGWTPLLEVIAFGSIEIAKLLLDHGAFPDTPGPMNNTPLHEAVRTGNVDMVKLLIERGASTCSKNSKGVTPLQIANDHIKLVLVEALRNKTDCVPPFKSILDSNNGGPFKIFPSLAKGSMNKLKALAAKHNLVIVSSLTEETSFTLIDGADDTGNCHPDLTALNSIVLGVPIVNADWLLDCDNTKLAALKNFEVSAIAGVYGSIHNSYVNKLKLFPPLFNGCHFYFLNLNGMYEISSYLKVNKETLSKLVRDGGGIVLKREPDPEAIPEDEQLFPFHSVRGGALENCSHFIIYRFPPKLAYNMKHLKSLPVGWLIDCIQNFKIVDP